MSDTMKFIVKVVISIIAITSFVIPEPASSITGAAILAALWGIDWSPDEGQGEA